MSGIREYLLYSSPTSLPNPNGMGEMEGMNYFISAA